MHLNKLNEEIGVGTGFQNAVGKLQNQGGGYGSRNSLDMVSQLLGSMQPVYYNQLRMILSQNRDPKAAQAALAKLTKVVQSQQQKQPQQGQQPQQAEAAPDMGLGNQGTGKTGAMGFK